MISQVNYDFARFSIFHDTPCLLRAWLQEGDVVINEWSLHQDTIHEIKMKELKPYHGYRLTWEIFNIIEGVEVVQFVSHENFKTLPDWDVNISILPQYKGLLIDCECGSGIDCYLDKQKVDSTFFIPGQSSELIRKKVTFVKDNQYLVKDIQGKVLPSIRSIGTESWYGKFFAHHNGDRRKVFDFIMSYFEGKLTESQKNSIEKELHSIFIDHGSSYIDLIKSIKVWTEHESIDCKGIANIKAGLMAHLKNTCESENATS